MDETERSLKVRFGEHRRPSNVNWEVSKHIHQEEPGHSVELKNSQALTVESKCMVREGVKEVIYICATSPSLNIDGGRYQLSTIWKNLVMKRVKKNRWSGARSLDINGDGIPYPSASLPPPEGTDTEEGCIF